MKTDLIYGVEDRPPFKDALFAALQHLLAIFVAIITPPLIIASALKLDVEKTSFLVSMSLFASGVSTFIQCRRIGPIGAKLLCIQGTSFSFIGPIIATGLVGGLPLIFGSCMAAAPIEMIVSRTFKYLRNIITPLVSGIVVLLIGLSLIKVGIVSCSGGYSAMDNGTFGSWENLSIADNKGKNFGLSFGLNRQRKDFYRSQLELLGMGLENRLSTLAGSLSGGQRQALALIMATMIRPDLLLLDEHTAALDPKSSDTVMMLTDKIVHEKNITTIMVTHNLRHAVEHGTRTVMMHNGGAIMDVSGAEKDNKTINDYLTVFNEISIECGN